MALKSYDELRKVDITPYVEQREGIDYLNWAKCIELLHDHGAEKVYFEPLVNERTGSSLFMTEQEFKNKNGMTRCYEVGVKVVVDDTEWIFRGPLMNGKNPVFDNSISQQRIWNCQTRLFVKCIAIHTGLGFHLWSKEEEATGQFPDEDLSRHDILKIKERVERLITTKMDGGMTLEDIYRALNIEADQFNVYMKQYNILDRMERAISKI